MVSLTLSNLADLSAIMFRQGNYFSDEIIFQTIDNRITIQVSPGYFSIAASSARLFS